MLLVFLSPVSLRVRVVSKPAVCLIGGVRAMRDERGRTVNKNNLPSKDCANCGRPFTWRKKWERCWDEVTCCSKRCRNDLKAAQRGARRRDESSEQRQERKSEVRSAKGDADAGMKSCDDCGKMCDVLVRCRTDGTDWRLICGRCWRAVSGGVVDGAPGAEGYTYGGMWKNWRREGASARMPASAKSRTRDAHSSNAHN